MKTDIELLNETESDLKWINENYEEIRNSFANKIIAVKNQKIVAVAHNSNELIQILEKNMVDLSDVLTKFIHPKNEITIYHEN